jgi:4-amino-4-deoxy-L-arabinose transferase-like glycosyltransferase
MEKIYLTLLSILFFAISLITLIFNPLIEDDASIYATAVKHMINSSNWLVAYITPNDLSSFLDKPPLGLWLLAIFPFITNKITEYTIHLPNVIYLFLMGLFSYYYLAGINISKKYRIYSTFVMITSFVLIVYSRAPKLDILITFTTIFSILSIYKFLRLEKSRYIYLTAIGISLGFLVKSGFAVVMPGILILFLLLNNNYRKIIFTNLINVHVYLSISLIFLIIGLTFFLQAIELQNYFLPYLYSLFLSSKYNTSYLGFSINLSSLLFLLITIFPWFPFFLSSLNFKLSLNKNNFRTFNTYWFISSLFFFIFLYKQTDLRSFTLIAPPMIFLSVFSLFQKKVKKTEIYTSIFISTLFAIYTVIVFFNKELIFLPLLGLTIASTATTILSADKRKLMLCSSIIILGYSIFFITIKPFVLQQNPYYSWITKEKLLKKEGFSTIIHRPLNRPMQMSADQCYMDFMINIDYYTQEESQLTELSKSTPKLIIFTDPKSSQTINEEFEVFSKTKESVFLIKNNGKNDSY